jgi:pyruvate/2-oxoglutarate/acetoin dehydrogenase E1 component
MRRRVWFALCVGLLVTLASTPFEAALWIESVTDDGVVLVLSDDSVWQVEFADQVNASLWLPMQRVAVAKTSRAGIYRIVRERQGDSVQARFVR